MKSKTEVLMLDKGFLEKQMAKLPGVPIKEEELPGVPGAKEEEFCSKCGGKLKHDEPDADDAGGDSDDDDDNEEFEKEKQVPKKLQASLVKRLVAKLFGGDIGQTREYSPLYSERSGISIITIEGEIGKRTNEPGKVDVDEVSRAVKLAMNANTKAVVLHINSPGGGSTGVEETGNIIKKLTECKPVFAFTDTLMASAAAWLGYCTNGVYCTPSSEIGSIGVYAKVVDYSKALEMQGINTQIFSAGSMKTMGQPEIPLTKEEADYIQADIDAQYEKFKALVRENRGNVEESVLQGQLFGGDKAVEVNLADECIQDLDTLISMLSEQ